ncbi:MAG TPA: hypothetical protein VM681_00840 [Candidatus Thermoplasmatota archaeon]|nr:hypothetical protein [Candidatus Thermoplasmatota archaeon]
MQAAAWPKATAINLDVANAPFMDIVVLAALVTILVLVGSYGMALAWRKWKAGKGKRSG